MKNEQEIRQLSYDKYPYTVDASVMDALPYKGLLAIGQRAGYVDGFMDGQEECEVERAAIAQELEDLKEAVRNYLNHEEAYANTVASNLTIPTEDSSVAAARFAETAVLYRNELEELLDD